MKIFCIAFKIRNFLIVFLLINKNNSITNILKGGSLLLWPL